jgi:hypothetical protein
MMDKAIVLKEKLLKVGRNPMPPIHARDAPRSELCITLNYNPAYVFEFNRDIPPGTLQDEDYYDLCRFMNGESDAV